MSLQAPVSLSDRLVDDAAETLVETQLQARREEFAQGSSRYLLRIFVAVSILLIGVWSLVPTYPQILIYAFMLLLLGLGAGLYPALQRRKRMTAGVYLLIGVTLMVAFLSPLLLPSLMPTTPFIVMIGIMVAMLLLGERRSRRWVGAFVLAYLVDVVVVGILSWSPFLPLPHSVDDEVFGAVSVFGILTAVISVRLMLVGQEQQFRQVQRLNLELGQRIQEVNETQRMLKRERNLLRTLIDAIPAHVYIKDTQSRFVDANAETALQMGAKTPNDLIGKTDFDFFTAELAAKYFADEQAVIQSGQPLLNLEESTVDQRTQQQIWFLTTKVPILDAQGVATGLVGVGIDITDRTRAQEQIALERDLLRTLIDHLPDYIFVKDADGRFVNSNTAHNQIAQVQHSDELLGKSAFDVFPRPLAVQFDADDREVLKSGQALVNVERTSIDGHGHARTVLTTKVPLHDSAGKVTGLVGISRDITERKQAEAQSFALAAEQQRGKLLRKFMTDISHDFRTPLSIIGTSAYLVGKTTDATKLNEYSQRLEEQVSRLTLLLDNFVELAQVGQQPPALPFQPTDLDRLLKTIVEWNQPAVEAKNQQLEYRCETHAALVLGDPTALIKAITQVVTNAIHYTPNEGKIMLRLVNEGENAVLEVADTGLGISAVDLPHIFESFYRVDSARSTETGGAGLGLSIAKKIVELLKGHIEVQSEFGAGSVFKIYLPIFRSASAESEINTIFSSNSFG